MRELNQDLKAWWKDRSGVPSEYLDNAAEGLEKLKDSWRGTACFEALDARYKDLQRELATFKDACGFVDTGF